MLQIGFRQSHCLKKIPMNIRTLYFKSTDITALCQFWSELLQVQPHKDFEDWKELWCGNIRLGFLASEEKHSTSSGVPVFEFENDVLNDYVNRALVLGAVMVEDGRDNPGLLSALMRDPFGNEFELSKFHL